MAISSKIAKAISKIIPKLFQDESLICNVIYKRLESIEFSEVEGVTIENFSDHTLTAIRTEKAFVPFPLSSTAGGSIASSQVYFLLRSLPDSASITDKIVETGTVWGIDEIKDIFGKAFQVKAKGI